MGNKMRIKVNVDSAGPSIEEAKVDGKYCKNNISTEPWIRDVCRGIVGIIRFDCLYFRINGHATSLKKTLCGSLLRCEACLEAEMPEGLIYKKTKDDVLFRDMWRSMEPSWPGWPIIAAHEIEVRKYTPDYMIDAVMAEVTGRDATLLALSLEKNGEAK